MNKMVNDIVKEQILGIGGNNFNVHAKVIITRLDSHFAKRHAIGAQKDHMQYLGVGSKEISIEGFTTVPYYKSNLWIIELLQRWGKPVPFVSSSISTLAYITNFEYREDASRYNSLIFNIKFVEWRPIGSIIGEVISRTGAVEKLIDGQRPIVIGGILTGADNVVPLLTGSDKW